MHEIAQPRIDGAAGCGQFAGAFAVRRRTRLTCYLALALLTACADTPDLYAPASEQQRALAEAETTSVVLTKAAIRRIEQLDRSGPTLNSVIAIDPDAVTAAERLDSERRAGRVRGPLHGISVILKDNIETAGELPTTAGSLALAANVTGRDAPLVERLRDAGAVILGKANLSEWANFRSTRSISGWSAIGGLTRNPYALDRSACGSSSGTAVAVSAGLVAVGIGTETDGSIICPASMNGVVGLKPTLGLVSRRHIVPLSPEQDTAGPITRTVTDAAALLTVIAGSDPKDPATKEADAHKRDYLAMLDRNSLAGARIGVFRGAVAPSPLSDAVFERALSALRDAGAMLVEVTAPSDAQRNQLSSARSAALHTEFRAAIDEYLASTPASVTTRTLDDVIAFNAKTAAETALFGQEIFETAARTRGITDPPYLEQRSTARRLAGPEGLDRMMEEAGVEALVAQTSAPASVVDPVNGSAFLGSPSTMPAAGGHPHLTVPMGDVHGLPVGLSFIGPRWSDARVLALGYAFEQRTRARRNPTYPSTLALTSKVAQAHEKQ
jgi:amidase